MTVFIFRISNKTWESRNFIGCTFFRMVEVLHLVISKKTGVTRECIGWLICETLTVHRVKTLGHIIRARERTGWNIAVTATEMRESLNTMFLLDVGEHGSTYIPVLNKPQWDLWKDNGVVFVCLFHSLEFKDFLLFVWLSRSYQRAQTPQDGEEKFLVSFSILNFPCLSVFLTQV